MAAAANLTGFSMFLVVPWSVHCPLILSTVVGIADCSVNFFLVHTRRTLFLPNYFRLLCVPRLAVVVVIAH